MKTLSLLSLILLPLTIGNPLKLNPVQASEILQIAQSNWKTFAPPDGNFSILMPGTPEPVLQQTVNLPVGQVTSKIFGIRSEQSAAYLVGYSDLPDAIATSEEKQQLFDSFIQGFSQSINGQLIAQSNIQLNNHAGREFKLQIVQGVTARGRVYLVDRRLYQIVVITDREEDLPQSIQGFLDSFRLSTGSTQPPSQRDRGGYRLQ